jgi:ABC-type phosphate transport system auxiliary subunit
MSDINIDDFEADNFDFDYGIDFTDSKADKQAESDKVRDVVNEATGNLDHKLEDLQSKMADIAGQLDMSETKALITQNANVKVVAMVQLIAPLLKNLQKHPERDTILWPGEKRVPMIEAQLKKMQAILDSD